MNDRNFTLPTTVLSAALCALILLMLLLVFVVGIGLWPGAFNQLQTALGLDVEGQLSDELEKQTERLAEIERKVSRLEHQIATTPAPSNDDPSFQPYVWTQRYPDQIWDGESKPWFEEDEVGRLIARAIVPKNQDCPTVTADGDSSVMKRRHLIYPALFPVKLCESKVPHTGSGKAIIHSEAFNDGEKTLAAWNGNAEKILLIGDTGCRVTYYTYQNCTHVMDEENRWPFLKIADVALKKKVDLIIHVGDYHYRERPCPAGRQALCGTTNWGYNWASWQADFFEPARKLLAHAPWVFVRGNHENCARAGAGWTDFFWPQLPKGRFDYCQDFHRPYVLKLADNLSLVVLDIANSESADYYVGGEKKKRAKLYSDWMKGLGQADLQKKVWIAMQQPPWQWPTKEDEEPETAENKEAGTAETKDPKTTENAEKARERTATVRDETVKHIQGYLRAPPSAGIEFTIELVVAGDTHVFQALGPKKGTMLPWVVISGMGGTKLDDQDDFKEILKAGGATIRLDDELDEDPNDELKGQSVTAFGWHGFGYTILKKNADKWKAVVYNEQGNPVYECDLSKAKTAACLSKGN